MGSCAKLEFPYKDTVWQCARVELTFGINVQGHVIWDHDQTLFILRGHCGVGTPATKSNVEFSDTETSYAEYRISSL